MWEPRHRNALNEEWRFAETFPLLIARTGIGGDGPNLGEMRDVSICLLSGGRLQPGVLL